MPMTSFASPLASWTPATVGWGIQSLGTYRGIPLYVYEAEYLNSAGAMTPYVPPDNVLVAASSLGGTMAYAGIAQVDEKESGLNVFASRRVPVVAFEALEDYRKFRLSSRPVPVPANLAAWGLLDVLKQSTGEQIIMSTITLQSSPGLSEILGAYDTGHWETVTAQLKPASWRLASRFGALGCRGRQWQVVTHCWSGRGYRIRNPAR